MKIVKAKDAEKQKYAETSSVLEYSTLLNEKNMDFCINQITGRYPMEGYCSNLEVEELCYVLDGEGFFHKKDGELIHFEKDDVIFIHKKDVYYWEGDFKVAIVCSPAWSKEQCKLYKD